MVACVCVCAVGCVSVFVWLCARVVCDREIVCACVCVVVVLLCVYVCVMCVWLGCLIVSLMG